MSEETTFLEGQLDKEEKKCDLERLADMLDSLTKAELEVSRKEEELKVAKAEKDKLSMEVIPEYLGQFQLSEIRLKDGRKVIVSEDLAVNVKKEDREKFYEWLKSRGEDDIIKLTVAFDKMDAEKRGALFDFIQEYDCKTDRGVHYQTQKKYFKELLGVGKEPEDIAIGINNGTMVNREDVEQFATVFDIKKTTIKR